MLGMSRTALCQVLSETKGELQQHTHSPRRRNSWRMENEMQKINAALEN